MKILFLITRGDSIGGAQMHVRDLAKRLQEDGHTVVVAFGKEGAFSELMKKEGIPHRVINDLERKISPLEDLLALRNIFFLIKELNPDLVALHSSKVGLLGRMAGKLSGKTTVFTAHGWSFTEGKSKKARKAYMWAEKVAAFFSDKIITVSEYDKQLALRHHIGSVEKIHMVHNGVPDIDLHPLGQFDTEWPIITMVARFQKPKEHNVLVEVLSQLEAFPWQLQLIGEDGGLMKETQELIGTLHLEDRVKILGNRSDVETLLAKSDIFVLISQWEGLPLTILEAMRAGLPVIASNVGGVSEAVWEGETGYLVASPSQLKKALSCLLGSPALREAMGTAGRRRYEDHFTFEQMYQSTYQLYEEAARV